MRFHLVALLAVVAVCTQEASAATLDRIRETGTVKLGYRTDAAPFSYQSSIGEAAGYAVELCRTVASDLKAELRLAKITVDYVPVTTEDQFAAIEKGKIDLLCGPTTVSLSRREKVDFSVPIFIDGASVLYRADGPDTFEGLAGHRIGVRSNTTTEEQLRDTLKELAIAAEVVPLENHADGLAGLRNGDISAYFADRGILQFLLLDAGSNDALKLSDHYFSLEPYGLGLAHGDDAFRLAVDRSLSRLYKSKDIETIFAKSFGSSAKPSELVRALYVISSLPE